MYRSLRPLLLLSILVAGCYDNSSPAPEAPAEPGAEVGPSDGAQQAVQPAAPRGVHELQEVELQIAHDLRAAVDDRDRDRAQQALSLLGRSLGELRGGTYSEPLVSSVRWFAAGDHADFRATIDGRRVVAALELLLDIRDGAAIHRLHESYGEGAAAERFRGGFSLSLSWSNAPSTLLHPEIECELRVNGEPAEGESTSLVYGSNTVACGDASPWLFVASEQAHLARLTEDGVRVFSP